MIFFSSVLKESQRTFCKCLENAIGKFDIPFSYLNGTCDYWIRDYLPIQIGANQFVQFSLTRDYYYQKDRHKWTNPAPICKALGIDPTIPIYNGKPIYLDGGNVILNPSRTKAILTEKVFADNDIPRCILSEILQQVLQVEQVIFIPLDPTEDSGHADGMVRFVNENTVVANDYSNADIPQNFKDRFYGTLQKNGLDVLLVPYNPVSIKTNGYWSAAGCYINFLQVGTKVFLPSFEDTIYDKAAILRFDEIFGAANVIAVPSREVALGGGVLNCISWEISTV